MVSGIRISGPVEVPRTDTAPPAYSKETGVRLSAVQEPLTSDQLDISPEAYKAFGNGAPSTLESRHLVVLLEKVIAMRVKRPDELRAPPKLKPISLRAGGQAKSADKRTPVPPVGPKLFEPGAKHSENEKQDSHPRQHA